MKYLLFFLIASFSAFSCDNIQDQINELRLEIRHLESEFQLCQEENASEEGTEEEYPGEREDYPER